MTTTPILADLATGERTSLQIEAAVADRLLAGTVTPADVEAVLVGDHRIVAIANHFNGEPGPTCFWECNTGHRSNGDRLGYGPHRALSDALEISYDTYVRVASLPQADHDQYRAELALAAAVANA